MPKKTQSCVTEDFRVTWIRDVDGGAWVVMRSLVQMFYYCKVYTMAEE